MVRENSGNVAISSRLSDYNFLLIRDVNSVETSIEPVTKSPAILRYETLFGIMTPLFDASNHLKTFIIPSYRDLRFFRLQDVLPVDSVFIGFGKPNVYVAFPDEQEQSYLKFDAKSFKRAPSRLMDTRGLAQSGLLFRFDHPTAAMKAALRAAATRESGSQCWTCVNANGRLLASAGFAIPDDKPLSQFYFPMDLARSLLTHGLTFQQQTVPFTVIRTVPAYLERFGWSVWKAQWLTFCRHGERLAAKHAKHLDQGWRASKQWLFKQWRKIKAPQPEEPVTLYPEKTTTQSTVYPLQVTYPSRLGMVLRWFWGPHSFFVLKPKDNPINDWLPQPLKAYKAKKKTAVNWLKQHVLFAPPIVALLRHQLVRHNTTAAAISEPVIFNMLRTHSDIAPHKYNIVVTGHRLVVMKLAVKFKAIDWVLTKHILGAGYSNDVRFAGELWKNVAGEIIVNNNSGTYQPSDEQLTAMIHYLNALFPNIPVHAEYLGRK